MKLRIRGNSLRLRLLRGEVRRLQEEGIVSESIQFGQNRKLTYSLERVAGTSGISAAFEGDAIRVLIPHEIANQWVSTDQVGMTAEQPIAEKTSLQILIEKDFTCLKPRTGQWEDESDAFPNPNPTCGGSST